MSQPELMAVIANDIQQRKCWIFKQSAGTGFDAPRAFVLASTKCVNDPDFAMQFVGRVMRVHQALRSATSAQPALCRRSLIRHMCIWPMPRGSAALSRRCRRPAWCRASWKGRRKKMLRQTASGATVITNKSSAQFPLTYANQLPMREPGLRMFATPADLIHCDIWSASRICLPGSPLPVLDEIAAAS